MPNLNDAESTSPIPNIRTDPARLQGVIVGAGGNLRDDNQCTCPLCRSEWSELRRRNDEVWLLVCRGCNFEGDIIELARAMKAGQGVAL